MKSGLKLLRWIFIVMAVYFISQEVCVGQQYSKKTEKQFNKARKQFLAGNIDKAEISFSKITMNVEHGESLYYLGEIEKSKDNKRFAFDYYARAIPRLQSEYDSLAEAGYIGDKTDDLIEMINQAQLGYNSCSMEKKPTNKVKEKSNPSSNNKDYNKSNTKAEIFEDELNNIQIRNFQNSPVRFLNQATTTTFYAAMKQIEAGFKLPNSDELLEVLTLLIHSDAGKNILENLNWSSNNTIRLISSTTFFNDNNENVCYGYRIAKDSGLVQKIEIELGDSASVLMIKN